MHAICGGRVVLTEHAAPGEYLVFAGIVNTLAATEGLLAYEIDESMPTDRRCCAAI